MKIIKVLLLIEIINANFKVAKITSTLRSNNTFTEKKMSFILVNGIGVFMPVT